MFELETLIVSPFIYDCIRTKVLSCSEARPFIYVYVEQNPAVGSEVGLNCT